jgi:hypothetical protein
MLSVFQMQQRPQLGVALDDDMTTPAAISTIWSTSGNKFLSSKVSTASTAFAGTATDFYVINKIL